MKRVWRIAREPIEAGNAVSDSTFMRTFRTEYNSIGEAEMSASKCATNEPGVRFTIFEVVSSYIVNGLTRETPEDLKAFAQDAVGENTLRAHATFPRGSRVRTTKDAKRGDWAQERLNVRWGVEGTIKKTHDSHGLVYIVRYDDGQTEAYDHAELEPANVSDKWPA